MKQFVSKDLCIQLHELRFTKPSRYYYEWTGATELEEATRPFWYLDGITVYTANQMKRALPKNVAVNRNVVEFGINDNDSIADQRAKVLIYLLKNKLLV